MKNEKDKDLTEEEKAIKAEVEGVVGEPLEEDELLAKYGGNPAAYASPPSMRGATSFNKSISPFSSVSLSKAGTLCAPKPAKGDKPPEWEEGEVSEETVHSEPAGEYNPPRKKKNVKKSLFVSAELSKADGGQSKEITREDQQAHRIREGYSPIRGRISGRRPHTQTQAAWEQDQERYGVGSAGSTSSAKNNKKGPFKLDWPGSWGKRPTDWGLSDEDKANRAASTKGVLEGLPHVKEQQKAEDKSAAYSKKLKELRALGDTKTEVADWASYPKKAPVKKSLLERQYGAQSTRLYDIGKSCGVCGKISKSCGDHKGGGCCEDCKKSMSMTSWHKSHLS